MKRSESATCWSQPSDLPPNVMRTVQERARYRIAHISTESRDRSYISSLARSSSRSAQIAGLETSQVADSDRFMWRAYGHSEIGIQHAASGATYSGEIGPDSKIDHIDNLGRTRCS